MTTDQTLICPYCNRKNPSIQTVSHIQNRLTFLEMHALFYWIRET